MLRTRFVLLVTLLFGLLFNAVMPVHAQEGGGLTISTTYPSMVVGIGETVTISMDIRSVTSQRVDLSVSNLPADWTAEFRGGGRVIGSVYVTEGNSSKVELRVTTPKTVAAGRYSFKVVAQGQNGRAEFPLEFIIKEKAPARLSFETEFPTIRGGSEANFNFSVTLKNEGDDDLTVSLLADAPRELAVTFKSAGKDITNLPTDVKAGSSVRIDITAAPLTSLAVGKYPFTVTAQSDTITTSIELTAEVVGQPQLSLTTPDGRLSGTAYINRDNQIKLVLRNTGNSPAAGVKLTASAPTGWTVTLDPETVVEVPAGGEVEVTANIKPSDKAISGDYVVTFRAQPSQSASKSADFRITVQTSTLWGAMGIGLIAVAVAIVGMAVSRFGRR
ncbi:MAG: NEW3 domain-containing protein [Chloroflexota bacterium]